jgi:antirestriction protein ArdC
MYKNKKTSKKNVYEIITAEMLKIIQEENKLPWQMPWITKCPRNIITEKNYRGFNSMHLNYWMHKNGYSSPYFGTFKQISEKGGKIKKGEKGFMIIFFSMLEKKIENEKKEKVKKRFPLLRYSTVFNLEQAEGEEIEKYKTKKEEKLQTDLGEENLIKNIEDHISQWQLAGKIPKIKHGGNRAFYTPSLDYIQIPEINQFKIIEEYYSTLFHEGIHSTGHEARLSREQVTNISFFGSHEYSKEELTAEMGACFLCRDFGVDSEQSFNNSKAYIQGWISKLENDPKMLIQASSKAQKAVDYLMGVEEISS